MISVDPSVPFRWRDGERVILFGRRKLAEVAELFEPGYVVLTTQRAAASAPEIVDRAVALHEVGPGRVDELARALRPNVRGELLVALGGGRVIDVAKALAAADPPREVAAIPTTLSGAEMTSTHRHASDVPAETPRVRPAIVVNDPRLSASQPPAELASSAANALGHAVEGPLTPLRNPVATLAGLEAARRIARGLELGSDARSSADAPHLDEARREAVALGALLAGYVIGSTGYGLHHVLSQTLARFARVGHGTANAIVLPHSLTALARRFPAELEALADGLGEHPASVAAQLCALTGAAQLRDVGVSTEDLDRCSEAAAERPELQMTPPPPDRGELRAIYEAAY